MERMPEGDLSEQMRQEAWEARKRLILKGKDPEQYHLDPTKSKDDTRIDPTLH